jgi:MbtH protein
MDENEDNTLYRVVVNHEEQYSIWPVDRDLPGGWRDAGKEGRKDECLAYINEHWTDMRPLSLRKHMAAASRRADARGRRAGAGGERPSGG